jgi:hypothetical protein
MPHKFLFLQDRVLIDSTNYSDSPASIDTMSLFFSGIPIVREIKTWIDENKIQAYFKVEHTMPGIQRDWQDSAYHYFLIFNDTKQLMYFKLKWS